MPFKITIIPYKPSTYTVWLLPTYE